MGATPIPIPNCLDPEKSLIQWLNNISPDAIVLSGGNDIGQFPNRDNTEFQIIRHAEKKSLPVLAICRGMQFLANYFDVGLINIENHVATRHRLVINKHNYGSEDGSVNSYHNLSIEKCPQGFEVTATSEDGNIEAMVNSNRNWEGWMWHPERELNFSKTDLLRARKLLFCNQ